MAAAAALAAATNAVQKISETNAATLNVLAAQQAANNAARNKVDLTDVEISSNEDYETWFRAVDAEHLPVANIFNDQSFVNLPSC